MKKPSLPSSTVCVHTPAPLLVKGIPFEMGGRTWIVPPLSLGALEQLHLQSSDRDSENLHEQIALLIDTAWAALQRNYPHLDRDSLAQMLDLRNATDMFAAIMNISGIPDASPSTSLDEANAGKY